jgi:hydrogenase maturation protease
MGQHPIAVKTIIVGLGNPILGDDGIGWKIAQEIEDHLKNTRDISINNIQCIDIQLLSNGGISLMEHLVGYNRAILIDAISTHSQPVGEIIRTNLESFQFPECGYISSAHDTSLKTALELGKRMGLDLPDEIYIIGIEIENIYEFSDVLSPSVSSAIPNAVQYVLDLI